MTYSCGRRFDGHIECWGRGSYGELSSPAGVFTQIASGGNHGCAIAPDGETVCWGAGLSTSACSVGGDRVNCGQSLVPAGTYVHVAAGWMHSCGLESSGSIRCWGSANHGALGVPSDLRWTP